MYIFVSTFTIKKLPFFQYVPVLKYTDFFKILKFFKVTKNLC